MRRRYVFSGRVQGVGFRAASRHHAEQYPLTGWVRNDPEGTVTFEAQGQPADIDRCVGDLQTSMARFISTVSVADIAPIEGESGFSIKR